MYHCHSLIQYGNWLVQNINKTKILSNTFCPRNFCNFFSMLWQTEDIFKNLSFAHFAIIPIYYSLFITSFMDGSLCKHAYRKLMVYERIFPPSQNFYASMKRRTHAFNNFKTILKDKKSQRFSAKCYITSLLYGGMHAKLATWGTIY